jgi:EmrB/QacA subfamily drug resistance transporter
MARLVNDANRSWWVLAGMTGSLSMILLDQTVVSVALPSIQRDLDLSQTQLQWVVNAYLLAIAALVAVGGRLADMFNRVHVFLLGLAIFVVASALCGLADGEAWIMVARGVQGVGAALMIPASAALVINAFPIEGRGRAMGIYAGVSMIFLSLGPLVGGVLTEWTWRAVFWINVPVGIATVVVTLLARPPGRVAAGQRLDLAGLVTLVPGLVAVVLSLMQSSVWGWRDPLTLGLLIGGVCLLALFVILELRVRQPLVELRLFRDRNFAGDNFALFCIQFSLIGLTVFGAIYVQDILGFSAIEAGLSLLALTIPLLLVAPRAGALYDKLGPRLLVGTGATLVAASLFWAGAVLDKLSYPWLVPGYIVTGIGVGLVMGPSNTDAMNATPRQLRGEASGVIQTVRQVGGTIGLAIMGTIVVNVQHSKLEDFLSGIGAPPSLVPTIENTLSQGGAQQQAATRQIPGAERTEIINGVQDAVVSGLTWAYYVGAIVMAVGAVLALAVLRHERFEEAEEAPVAPTA